MASTGIRPTGTRLLLFWTDRAWPMLAGALVAVGTVAIVASWGFVGALVAFAGLWAVLTVTALGMMSDFDLSVAGAFRVALLVTVVVVDLAGLLLVSPVAGGIAATVAGLTSPLATAGASSARQRLTSSASQKITDRRFARIVADLEKDRSW